MVTVARNARERLRERLACVRAHTQNHSKSMHLASHSTAKLRACSCL